MPSDLNSTSLIICPTSFWLDKALTLTPVLMVWLSLTLHVVSGVFEYCLLVVSPIYSIMTSNNYKGINHFQLRILDLYNEESSAKSGIVEIWVESPRVHWGCEEENRKDTWVVFMDNIKVVPTIHHLFGLAKLVSFIWERITPECHEWHNCTNVWASAEVIGH